jgi:hypothetical protein
MQYNMIQSLVAAFDTLAHAREEGSRVMKDVDNSPLPDEAPEADAIEQRLEVVEEGDTGLDIRDDDALSDLEANPADVIEQSIMVPDPEDEYGPG